MRPSRGMGNMNSSKMPKAKTIIRKDDPNKVMMYAKGGKVMRKAEGGDVEYASDYGDSGTFNYPASAKTSSIRAPVAQAKTFGGAFRSARGAGDKTFEWNGKKYTTDLASSAPKPAARAAAAPVPASKASTPPTKPPTPATTAAPTPAASTPKPAARAVANTAPKTFTEAMKRQADAQAKINAARDKDSDAAAKRRGDEIKGGVKRAVDFVAGRAPMPGAPKNFKEAMDRVQYKKGGKVAGGSADTKQDKALIKKAFRQHEIAEHGGKHVPLRLKKGGNWIQSAVKKPGASKTARFR